jgi:hypothetical protein
MKKWNYYCIKCPDGSFYYPVLWPNKSFAITKYLIYTDFEFEQLHKKLVALEHEGDYEIARIKYMKEKKKKWRKLYKQGYRCVKVILVDIEESAEFCLAG